MEAHHHYGVAATLGIRYGLRGFIPACRHDVMEFSPRAVAEIHEFGGTILGSSRGPQPVDEIVDALERLNIGILILIGGVGTMRAAHAIQTEIAGRGLPMAVVCIPKTVDNDIHFVSRTFGFMTASEQATEAIACAHVEAVGAPYGLGLVKVMGRNAGFIAAEASMGLKNVNFVLVPEEHFALHGPGGVLEALEARLRNRGHDFLVFLAQGLIGLGDVAIGELLDVFLALVHFVFGDGLVVLEFLEGLVGVAADVAHGNSLGFSSAPPVCDRSVRHPGPRRGVCRWETRVDNTPCRQRQG